MTNDTDKLVADTLALAARYGLHLAGDITFNETGLDFRVGFAADTMGQRWVLRIPRRDDVQSKLFAGGSGYCREQSGQFLC